MKKVAVFNLREFDEAEWFEKYAGDLGLELSTCPDAPDMDNIASVTEGCECADIITSQITRELMAEFARNGIRYITTRIWRLPGNSASMWAMRPTGRMGWRIIQ